MDIKIFPKLCNIDPIQIQAILSKTGHTKGEREIKRRKKRR
jgi:hypothetical protein